MGRCAEASWVTTYILDRNPGDFWFLGCVPIDPCGVLLDPLIWFKCRGGYDLLIRGCLEGAAQTPRLVCRDMVIILYATRA